MYSVADKKEVSIERSRTPVGIDEGVDDSTGVEEGEALGNLRHDLEDVPEVGIAAAVVHYVVQRTSVDPLLQYHHLVQNSCEGKPIHTIEW